MKHAILILAHNESELLTKLVTSLDDSRNDIFIHWDAKAGALPDVTCDHAGLSFCDRRVDVRWGDISVIEAEYVLMEDAVRRGPYAHYHLISGVDLPIKNNDWIHTFFDAHFDTEFIGFSSYDGWGSEADRKVRRYHFFPHQFGKNSGLSPQRVLRSLSLKLQDIAARYGLKRNKGLDIRKGTQWISVTDGFVKYALQQKDFAMRTFHHTFCPDEIVMQTLCWNSPFKDKVYDYHDEGHSCLRAIRWENNQVLNWAEEDLPRLRESEAIFARKFTGEHMDIVNKILNHVSG